LACFGRFGGLGSSVVDYVIYKYVGRLTSETKEKLKTGYIQRLFMVDSCLSQDVTEVYMILHK
jgi:hypothetical protein